MVLGARSCQDGGGIRRQRVAYSLTAGRAGEITLSVVLFHRIRPVLPSLAPHIEHLWMAPRVFTIGVAQYDTAGWRHGIHHQSGRSPEAVCARRTGDGIPCFDIVGFPASARRRSSLMRLDYVHLIGVRMRAGGAWPFLGIPLSEFTDQVVELESDNRSVRLTICAIS